MTSNPAHQFTLLVQGHNPAPQGSKAYRGHRYNAKAGRPLPVLTEQSKRVDPWRQVVTTYARHAAARQRMRAPLDGPLEAKLVFIMEPARNAQGDPIRLPDTRHYGDLDKLQRSTFDALADARVIADDARIIRVEAMKVFPGRFARLDQAGVYVRIRPLDPDTLTL